MTFVRFPNRRTWTWKKMRKPSGRQMELWNLKVSDAHIIAKVRRSGHSRIPHHETSIRPVTSLKRTRKTRRHPTLLPRHLTLYPGISTSSETLILRVDYWKIGRNCRVKTEGRLVSTRNGPPEGCPTSRPVFCRFGFASPARWIR